MIGEIAVDSSKTDHRRLEPLPAPRAPDLLVRESPWGVSAGNSIGPSPGLGRPLPPPFRRQLVSLFSPPFATKFGSSQTTSIRLIPSEAVLTESAFRIWVSDDVENRHLPSP